MPIKILKTLYQSLIVPYLTYGIELWFSASNTLTNRVQILQKKAVRAMNCLPYNAHTHDFFRDMRLLKLYDLHNIALMTDMYRRVGSDEIPVQAIPRNHDYNTRNRNLLNIPRFNRTATQNSFVYQQIIKWNNIPSDLKEANSGSKFKVAYKSYLQSLY